jgi:hypothetical protein
MRPELTRHFLAHREGVFLVSLGDQMGRAETMFPGGVSRALGIAEASEWFDWMRREIPTGGIALPNEEASVAFAGHALRLRSRIRDVYRHLPISLEDRFLRSAIVYQCWELQRHLYANAKWPEAVRVGSLLNVKASRYISPVGPCWGYHLVEGCDGFRYAVTVPTGFSSETIPATEIICNRLARLVGLAVPDVAVVLLDTKLLGSRDTRGGRPHREPGLAPELCAGFRCQDRRQPGGAFREGSLPPGQRNKRQLRGALVLDTWTLNLLPREWSADLNEATGRNECTLAGGAGGLAGGDWLQFLGSTHESLPAAQAIAATVRRWEQIGPWVNKMANADLNPMWEIAFQMPPLWYGGCRRTLSHVLDKLGRRQWELGRAMHHFIRVGYLPSLKMQPWGGAAERGAQPTGTG